jgi:hypothetical protein
MLPACRPDNTFALERKRVSRNDGRVACKQCAAKRGDAAQGGRTAAPAGDQTGRAQDGRLTTRSTTLSAKTGQPQHISSTLFANSARYSSQQHKAHNPTQHRPRNTQSPQHPATWIDSAAYSASTATPLDQYGRGFRHLQGSRTQRTYVYYLVDHLRVAGTGRSR